jgi:hypothetical protein
LIEAHIRAVTGAGGFGGIEGVFAEAVLNAHKLHGEGPETERPLNAVGLSQEYEGREAGRLDCFLPSSRTGIEYKAVRMPRSKPSPEYDAGQLLADYRRLNNPEVLRHAYMVVFVWGPLADDTKSAGGLYRAFHNQMFVDCRLARPLKSNGIYEGPEVQRLGWQEAWALATPPSHAAAVRKGSVGAVIFSVV